MAVQFAGGDVFVPHVVQVTAAANLAGKSLITAGGAAATNASNDTFGVISKDTPNTDIADVKVRGGIIEVIATGTVAVGNQVEVLQAAVYANINGTSTSTTSAGVTALASGDPIGYALSASDAGGTVLVFLYTNPAKSA